MSKHDTTTTQVASERQNYLWASYATPTAQAFEVANQRNMQLIVDPEVTKMLSRPLKRALDVEILRDDFELLFLNKYRDFPGIIAFNLPLPLKAYFIESRYRSENSAYHMHRYSVYEYDPSLLESTSYPSILWTNEFFIRRLIQS